MADKRRGLGRGLGALIPANSAVGTPDRPVDVFFPQSTNTDVYDDPTQSTQDVSRETVDVRETPENNELDDLLPVPGAIFAEIPVSEIQPNSKQPRHVFDEEDMAELVHSVQTIGVLQPIVVRENAASTGTKYELIMGERRWRASQTAGLATIPAIVRHTSDDDLLRDALLENLHRSQLNPLEEAAAYHQLLQDFGCTHDELALRIGRSRPQISNTVRLLNLPPLVQRRVSAGVLSAGHARALLGLKTGAAMERLAQRIVAEGLSVRTTEEIVALGDAEPRKAKSGSTASHHPYREKMDYFAGALSDSLDTRVGVSMGKKKGKVTIEFASVDDLDRIMKVLNVDN